MDGDLKPLMARNSGMADIVARSADFVRPAPSRAKTLRWLAIVGLLLALFLGGLYGFNRYREQAIASFFASKKPPPAQIAAGTATRESGARLSPRLRPLPPGRPGTAPPQIRAPFKGRLGVRQVEVGQYLNAGAAIVTLSDLKHLYVNFTLPSTMRAQIVLGQKVNVTADAFPGRAFEATITTLEPQIRADTRTIAVQATLDNPDEALLPGMYINAAVVLPAEPDR